MSAIFTIGIFLCCFLALLLFTKRGGTISDSILAIWMIAMALQLFFNFLHFLGYWDKYPHLVGITHPFPLLYGPFLYLYIRTSLISKKEVPLRSYLLHFLPFFLLYLMMIPFLFFTSPEEKILMNSQDYESEYQGFFSFSVLLFIISITVYSILSYKLISKHEKLLHDNYSYEEMVSLKWVQYLMIGIGSVFALSIIVAILTYTLDIDPGFNTDIIGYTCLVIFIVLLGFFGIRYRGLFAEPSRKQPVDASDNPKENEATYSKSAIPDNDAVNLQNKLVDLMDHKSLYLQPKLSLGDLADALETTTHSLSYVINHNFEMNFYDFINGYRVNEFIRRATSPDNSHLSLLAIALDSGFNSKSSFNQVFKKHTGKTPSEYLKSL